MPIDKELEAKLLKSQEQNRLNPPNPNLAGMVQNGGINNSWWPVGKENVS